MRLRIPFSWIATTLAALTALLILVSIYGIVYHHAQIASWGWEGLPQGEAQVVSWVDAQGPAAGKLQVGDTLLKINGDASAARFGQPLTSVDPGQAYSVDVLRSGTRFHYLLALGRVNGGNGALVYLGIALVNLGLAIWIISAKQNYTAARLSIFYFLNVAITVSAYVLLDYLPPLHSFLLGCLLFLGSKAWLPLRFVLFFDLAAHFPEKKDEPAYLNVVRWCLYMGGAAISLVGLLPLLADLLHLERRSALFPPGFPLEAVDHWARHLGPIFATFCIVAGLYALARNYRKLPDLSAKRKVRLLVSGFISLFASFLTVRLLHVAINSFPSYTSLILPIETFFQKVTTLASVLLSVAIAYAIVTHGYFGMRLAIRIGVQYLLARNFLRAVLYLPLAALLVDLAVHANEPLRNVLLARSGWFFALLVVAAVLALRYRARLLRWVDHRFFRSAYEEEVIIAGLIESLQDCDSVEEVALMSARQIQGTLRASSISILYRPPSTPSFRVLFPTEATPVSVTLCERLNREPEHIGTGSHLSVWRDELSALQSGATSETTTQTVSKRRGRLTSVTPIRSVTEELTGVLVLGEKRSEQQYSKRDDRLLDLLATQIGLAFEMVSLRQQVRHDERVRVEVLGRLDDQQVRLVVECPECGRCYDRAQSVCRVDQSTLELTLPIERLIDGKYRLERRLASGGMGVVFEAHDLRLRRTVAVKVMTGRLFGNGPALRRFRREARTAANLHHPHIAAVYDFGSLRGGGAYLVMPLIHGRSMRTALMEDSPVTPARLASWAAQLCDAIGAAHESGVLHRDLKPENIMIEASEPGSEMLTVLDFGLAKIHREMTPALPGADGQLSFEGNVLGTHGYMSPEQRQGAPVDLRTDVFSIGVLIAEALLEARPPSAGASGSWLQDVTKSFSLNEDHSRAIRILGQCLEDDPNERPETLRRLASELVPALVVCTPMSRARAAGAANGPRERASNDDQAPTLAY